MMALTRRKLDSSLRTLINLDRSANSHLYSIFKEIVFHLSDIFIFGEVQLAARENSPDASPSHFRNFVNVVPLDLVSFIGSFDSFMTSTFRAKPASNFQYKGVKLSQHSMVLWYSVSFY